ncbi:MAG TPA: response regulator, partial [Caulobacteraceae bacterium]
MSAKVLVVEDEDALATLLDYNLSKEGYTVFLAPDGEEALLRVDEEEPDLVVLDWMLPKVSGIEVCRRLRQGQKTRNLPIIMLTARGEETDRIRGLDTGADDYVVKPFSMSELTARVRAVLRRIRPGLTEDVARYGD